MRMRYTVLLVVLTGLAVHIGIQVAEAISSSIVNQVLSLDGETGYAQVVDSESLHSFTNAITIETRVKAFSFYPGGGTVNSIIRKNMAPGGENFFLRFRKVGGRPLVEMSPGRQIRTLQGPHEFMTGKWYHVAGTYDGTTIVVFVNGLRIKSEAFSGPMCIDKSDLFIGKGDPEFSFGEYFHGVLDEIRIWNVARSQKQIQATMNTPLTRKEEGLVAYWNFDDGTAKDLSLHGNDGSLHGDARIVELAQSDSAPTQAKGPFARRTPGGGRERALDGIVHLEESVVLDIPDVRPLCDEMDIVKRRVNVGDCELYCEIEGGGMPMVLINGGPGSTHQDFHPAFSRGKSFAKIVYYDQRGCGRSDWKAGEGYSVKQAVDDLEGLRKALGIEKWIVLGHSYGGLLAQSYCVTYPDRAAGLILVASVEAMPVRLKPTRQYYVITDKEQAKMESARREIERLQRAGKNVGEEHILFNNWLNGDWKRQCYYKPTTEEIARIARYGWKHDRVFRDALCAESESVDLKGAFQDCPIPTLILEGKWDLTWNTDKAGILHQNHPNGRLVTFEESAHNPFDDEPEAFFTTLKDFIVNLPEVPSEKFDQWKAYLTKWREERKAALPSSVITSE